ncbi:MAG: hypothetical protein IJ849_12420 [Selenomonadaceae bacterium]|nr:hypothetical protein [Selenomonadaceae bacterium]
MASSKENKVFLREVKLTGVEPLRLLDLNIREQMGEHGLCRLRAQLAAPLKTEDLTAFHGKTITLKTPGDDFIFGGVVTQVTQTEELGEFCLELTAKTLSAKLDSETKSRTWQKAAKTLKDVLSSIATESGIQGAEISGGAKESEVIPTLLYQAKETDWEFLGRLAAGLGLPVFADAKTDKLRLSVGPQPFAGSEGLKTAVGYDTGRSLDLLKCARLKSNIAQFRATRHLTHNPVPGVGYAMDKGIVTASRLSVSGGILVNELTITPKEGCLAEAFQSAAAARQPHYLTGTVLKAIGLDESKGEHNTLKLKFDCDKKQDEGEALSIPYANVVSNYLYNMPGVGDRVAVYFGGGETLLAIGSLRDKSPTGVDPKKKSFFAADQGWEFASDAVEFTAGKKEKKSQLGVSDAKGVYLTAKKDVKITSDGDIIWQAGASKTADNHLKLLATHSAGYIPYTATGGAPPAAMINTAASTVGEVAATLKSAGAKAEKAELSELVKALDKKTGTQTKSQEQNNSSGGGSGDLKIKSGSTLLLKVGDSSIEVSKGTIKTRTLYTVGYMPGAGVGPGSPAAIAPGSVNNRSATVNAEKGSADRSRLKEGGSKSHDSKRLSLGG